MALTDPRAVVRHDENHARYETFKIDNSEITYDADEENGSAQVGLAVALASDDTVDLCGDGEAVFGKLIKVEADGFCNVQIGGFCELPGGNGATLTVGHKIVGALNASSAKGYIKIFAATTPTAAEVALAARTRGLIVNNDTTTAVVVDLG